MGIQQCVPKIIGSQSICIEVFVVLLVLMRENLDSRVMISLQYLNGVIGGAVIAHHEFQFHIWIFLELLIQDGIHLLTDIFATIICGHTYRN